MQLPQTLDMFMVSGASDFLAHVAVKDTQQLRDLVLDLAKRQEIADIRSSVWSSNTTTEPRSSRSELSGGCP